MLPTRLPDTTQADLEQLIRDGEQEGPHLDYKRELPTVWDNGSKHALISDVTAFANASGGDIVYGVDENDDAQASRIVPQVRPGIDQEVRRLQDFLLNLVEPRLPGTEVYPVPVTVNGTRGHVIIIRIPESWAGPHRVKTNQHFFVRDGLRNRQLDMPEIRAQFLRTENRAQRVRDFRNDRISKIMTGEVPYRLAGDSVLVLHLLPLQAALGTINVDPVQYLGLRRPIPVVAANGGAVTSLVNLDGAVGTRNLSADGTTNGYTLFFRTGFIETTWVLGSRDAMDPAVLPSVSYEGNIINFVSSARNEMRHWGIDGPAIAMLSILNAKGVRLHFDHGDYVGVEGGAFDRDVLAAPDVELPGERDAKLELKPLFDLIWQSAGFPGSPHYDKDGNWAPQRR